MSKMFELSIDRIDSIITQISNLLSKNSEDFEMLRRLFSEGKDRFETALSEATTMVQANDAMLRRRKLAYLARVASEQIRSRIGLETTPASFFVR